MWSLSRLVVWYIGVFKIIRVDIWVEFRDSYNKGGKC